MGADVNCRIGRIDRDEYRSVIGVNGFYGSNNIGKNLLEIYWSNNLRVENTIYTHDNCTTCMSRGLKKTPSTHDIFDISQTTHKRIRYCIPVNDRVKSYHAAVEIKLAVTYIRFKHNTLINRGTDCTNISTDEGYAASYYETLKI